MRKHVSGLVYRIITMLLNNIINSYMYMDFGCWSTTCSAYLDSYSVYHIIILSMGY